MNALNAQRSFNLQLRQLMPSVDKAADRLARLRHYLAESMTPYTEQNQEERTGKAADLIGKWKAEGIPQVHFDFGLAPDFRRWWAMQLSDARRKAGSHKKPRKAAIKRKPKSKARQVVVDTRK